MGGTYEFALNSQAREYRSQPLLLFRRLSAEPLNDGSNVAGSVLS